MATLRNITNNDLYNNIIIDNDGDALIDGALYFNTTGNVLKYWDGSAWQNVEATDTSNFATNGFSIAMAIAL